MDAEALPRKKTLAELAKELEECQQKFEEAERNFGDASRRKADALNYLNHAQKAFDEAVAAIRKGAHRETDWARSATGRV